MADVMNDKKLVRVYWDNWGHVSAFNLYIMWNDGTYDVYDLGLQQHFCRSNSSYSDMKLFTAFRKFAKIKDSRIVSRFTKTYLHDKEEIEQYLKNVVESFIEEEWDC